MKRATGSSMESSLRSASSMRPATVIGFVIEASRNTAIASGGFPESAHEVGIPVANRKHSRSEIA